MIEHQSTERGDQPLSFQIANAYDHFDTSIFSLLDALARNMRGWMTADDDSLETSRNHSISTRWRLAEMTAGLKSHIQFRAASLLSSTDRIDLRV